MVRIIDIVSVDGWFFLAIVADMYHYPYHLHGNSLLYGSLLLSRQLISNRKKCYLRVALVSRADPLARKKGARSWTTEGNSSSEDRSSTGPFSVEKMRPGFFF